MTPRAIDQWHVGGRERVDMVRRERPGEDDDAGPARRGEPGGPAARRGVRHSYRNSSDYLHLIGGQFACHPPLTRPLPVGVVGAGNISGQYSACLARLPQQQVRPSAT